MVITSFPSIDNADEHGLVALGGDFEIPSLLLAYSQAIFPWPINENYPLAWFSPDPRGILQYKNLHISRTLKKIIKQNIFEIKFNTNFKEVITNCANTKRTDSSDTWISKDIIDAYCHLFSKGYAYSAESYFKGKLVGGVYGVLINKFASGESMFFTKSNASKVALIHLMNHLYSFGINYLDTQMLTDVVKTLGGELISRDLFLKMVQKSI